jgi:beta-phosphoglucomutase-like phosphatase (HAD superfamily)
MRTPIDIDAVVFDCDGLLAETEAAWTRAETAIFREHGRNSGAEQKQLLIGGTLASGGEAMAAYYGLPGAGSAVADRLADLVWQELAAGAPALPGARDMAETLRHRGVPTGVAAARAAKMFVVGIPSMLGAVLDAHVTYDSLAHPNLRSWMASCTSRLSTVQAAGHVSPALRMNASPAYSPRDE